MDTALDIPEKENLNARFGIKGAVGTAFGQHDLGLASFAPSGFTTYGSVCCWPNDDELKIYDFADNLLWEINKHSLKFGAQFQHLKKRSLSARNNRGSSTSAVFTPPDPLQRAEQERHRQWDGGLSTGLVPHRPDPPALRAKPMC